MRVELEEKIPMANHDKLSLPAVAPPRDRWHFVYWSFLLLGAGAILPWNAFINAETYFTKYKFVSDSEYAKNYLAYVGLCSQIPNQLLSLVNCLLPAKSGLIKRATAMLIVMGIVFGNFTIMPFIDTSTWLREFFILTMMSVVVTSSGMGMLQNILYGMAADFPKIYSNAAVVGSNVSGTLMSVLYLISLLVSPSYQVTAAIYFALAFMVICLCLTSLLMLRSNAYFRFVHLEKAEKFEMNTYAAKTKKGRPKDIFVTLRHLYQVFVEIKVQLFNIFFVFFISLAIFPTMMAAVRVNSDDFLLSEKYFTPVACFLSFNVSALLGNIASNCFQFPKPGKLWIPILLRVLFIPFFLLCNMQPVYRTIPVYITSDVAFIIGGIMLGLSGGYFASVTMMYIPRLISPDKARTAGMLGAFFLVFGITCGVNFVLIINYINENLGPCTAGFTVNATTPVCT